MAWRFVEAPWAFVLGAPVYLAVLAATAAADGVHRLSPGPGGLELHSTCDALGQRILEVNVVRSALYQEQFAHYSPSQNRCYVEMRVQSGDQDLRTDRFGRYLYDGETRELLAFAQIRGGKKSGRVYDLQHRTTSFENAGWDDASAYISIKMMDHRR
jgi:hypothetical protein